MNFVAETPHNLEIPVVAGDHQQLLERLRTLRQGVELPRIHTGRHDEIAGTFRRGLDQIRRLNLEETLGVEEVADLVRKAVPKHQSVLQRIAPQVEITEFRTQIFTAVAFVFNGERRGDALVQDADVRDLDLDVAGRHLGVFRLAFNDFPGRLDDEFPAEGGGRRNEFRRCVGFDHELGDAVTVAQVDERHAAEFAGFLYPAGEGDGLSGVCEAEFSAGVCPVHSA